MCSAGRMAHACIQPPAASAAAPAACLRLDTLQKWTGNRREHTAGGPLKSGGGSIRGASGQKASSQVAVGAAGAPAYQSWLLFNHC